MFPSRPAQASMLSARRNACKSVLHAVQRRGVKSDAAEATNVPTFKAATPLARELQATNFWSRRKQRVFDDGEAPNAHDMNVTRRRRQQGEESVIIPMGRSKLKKKVTGDKLRVNIVSEPLCDDILSYVGNDLARHKGCDLIDLNPGPGLWSGKLHDFLQPRSHLLLEPDFDLYEPWLRPLTEKPGVRVFRESGLVWRDLGSVLSPQHLPHQKEIQSDEEKNSKELNDTLLVTANICFNPKKRFRGFESLAVLVLHQFIESITSNGLFQKYGNVRMLVWTRKDDAKSVVPKCHGMRRRSSLIAELNCESVREIVSTLTTGGRAWYSRDENLSRGSALWAAQRMKRAGVSMPEHRMIETHKQALQDLEAGHEFVPGSETPMYQRPYTTELARLQKLQEQGGARYKEADHQQWRDYGFRRKNELLKYGKVFDYQQRLDAMVEMAKNGGDPEKIAELEREFNAEFEKTWTALDGYWDPCRINLHYMRQDPPLMFYDRRTVEPMTAKIEEVYPNADVTLLDIQPKGCHPLFRQVGQGSSRAGDIFDLLTRGMMERSKMPLDQALEAVWPGAADFVMPRWTTTRDPRHGGLPFAGPHTSVTARMLNQAQWEQLMEVWMQWPLKPTFFDMVARISDEIGGGDYGDRQGNSSSASAPTGFLDSASREVD